MLRPNGRQRLNTLLQRNDASLTFQSAGHGFKDAVKYVLPKLLLGPIYHCLHFFEVIKVGFSQKLAIQYIYYLSPTQEFFSNFYEIRWNAKSLSTSLFSCLLLSSLFSCLLLYQVLIELSKNEEDRESLCQADGLLHQLKVDLEHKLGPGAKRKPQ